MLLPRQRRLAQLYVYHNGKNGPDPDPDPDIQGLYVQLLSPHKASQDHYIVERSLL